MSKLGIAAVMVGILTGSLAFADWDFNPGFESPYTDGWASFDPSITSNSSDFAFTGNLSLKFDTPDFMETMEPGGGLPLATVVDSPHNAATPGGTYIAEAYYYVDQPLLNHERLGLGIFWLKLNAGGTALEFSAIDPGDWTTVFGPELPTFPAGAETVGAWTRIEYTGTAPADAEFMQIALEVHGDGSAVYFDDVSVIPEPVSILLVGMGIAAVSLTRRKRIVTRDTFCRPDAGLGGRTYGQGGWQ